jgi:hypothetical protein
MKRRRQVCNFYKPPFGGHTFYDVTLAFPRRDAASLLFGFDSRGKIAGIGLKARQATDNKADG